MAAALRVSANEKVQYSEFTLATLQMQGKSPIAAFDVHFRTEDLSKEEQSCWVPLFANPAIARGFPVPERKNAEQGLEISLEMMAALGGARHLTEYNGGLVLKGYSTLFVPVECHEDSVQWHFIQGSDGKHMPYRELRERSLDRVPLASVNAETVKNKRNFLGWWISAETHLGTADADYKSIGWTRAQAPHRPVKFSGVEIGFQSMITGKANFVMGAKDGKHHFGRTGPFQKIIRHAEKAPVVLYNQEDRQGWLVFALDVILHIIQTRYHLSFYDVGSNKVEISAVDCRNTNGSAGREAALANQWKPLYEGLNFQDAFLDIWSQMERLREKDCSIEAHEGIVLNGTFQSKLHGWEYMALVEEKKYHQKEVKIARSSGGWVDLVTHNDALILLATGLKEIIKPAQDIDKLCRKWRSLPKGMDYLAVGVPMLEMFYTEAGSKDSCKQLTSSHLQWHRGSSLFERCIGSSSDHCGCDRTQHIYHDSLLRILGRVRPPGELEENGCVIFGRANDTPKPPKNAINRENPVYTLPNVPLHDLEASSPTLEANSLITPPSSGTIGNNGYRMTDVERRPSPLYPSNDIPHKQCTVQKRRRSMPSEQTSNSSYHIKPLNKDSDAAWLCDKDSDDCLGTRPVVTVGNNKGENAMRELAASAFDDSASIHLPKRIRRVPNLETHGHRHGCSCAPYLVGSIEAREPVAATNQSYRYSVNQT